MRETSPPWHARPAEEVLEAQSSATTGLSEEEAARRLQAHGPNRLPSVRRRGPVLRLLRQFHNLLIYILLVAAAVTAGLQHWVDSGVIVGVVLINALIGFLQEGKAERSLEAITGMLSPQASVTRGGHRVSVPAEELVPGDIVHLAAGDKVPADLRLIAVSSLQVQEAVLTGESVPVEKTVEPVGAEASLGDRACMAYSGTLITYGKGRGVVVATGADTEIGRIGAMLAGVQQLTTPLLRQMTVFGRWLTGAILMLAALAFALGVQVQGYAFDDMFLAAVGLAVAAIPEGLPAIMTITLAIGVAGMARRRAIIRRLPAVETLGAVTVICSDKTGTLTRNELTVQRVVTAASAYHVSGVGYAPEGGFALGDHPVDPGAHPDLMAAVQAGVRCNDAELGERHGEWTLQGNPTDGALLALGLKAGLRAEVEQSASPGLDVIPFDSGHKFMATLHDNGALGRAIYIKGAPERLLEMCTRELRDEHDVEIDRAAWHAGIEELAAQGLRTLAVAVREAAPDHGRLRFEDVAGGFTLLAVFGLIDPPREEAVGAVTQCREAGIEVKMITGDHAATASAVAGQLGIGHGRATLTGRDIDGMDDHALVDAAEHADVFARTTPEHKLRLVRALQARRHVVAMTGDGVNDAPALKRADVGIAMGRRGTEAAKEAAEMVLTDDNFASIVNAVHEGRTVYDNLKKSILFILPTNGGEALTVLAAIVLGALLPITPVQILWVNMVTAVTLALALAFEPAEPDVMRRPPRRRDEPILSGFLVWRVAFVSAVLVIGAFGLFVLARSLGAGLDTARTVAVNTLVVGEIAYLLNSRLIVASAMNRNGLLGSRAALIAIGLVLAFQGLFTYAPPMQFLFGTAAIGPEAWAVIAGFGVILFLVVEAEKAVLRRRRHGRPPVGAPEPV